MVHCLFTDVCFCCSFDPASLAILERINHVASLIESKSSNSLQSPQLLGKSYLHPASATENPPGDTRDAFHHFQINDESYVETPGFPANRSNCESVLQWPIFYNLVPDTKSFVLGPNNGPNSPPSTRVHPTSLGRGIREEDFILLSQRFLFYVHVKNPILEVSDFTHLVRDVAETGLRWDGSTCLMVRLLLQIQPPCHLANTYSSPGSQQLLACALGCISEPFEMHESRLQQSSSTANTPFTEEMAIDYYFAAKKRLGLIPPSLLEIQCLFLCGILEMYLLNALGAWHYFNQACVQLRNLFWRQGYTGLSFEQYISREPGRLEQRLYWSCMKSEWYASLLFFED